MTPGPRTFCYFFASLVVCWKASAGSLTPGNLLVNENDVLTEYTPAGALVQSFPIPYPGGRPGGEHSRDVFVDASGLVHVYNGTFDPYVSTLNPTTGVWIHNNFADWDTVNNVSYGGITFFLGFVFATDMEASLEKGIVGFDTGGGYAGERFARIAEYIDVTIGLDSLLYALRDTENEVDVFDPATRGLLRTVTLAKVVRGCTVNLAGNFFCASWDANIYHFDPDGSQLNSVAGGASSLVDIDITFAGQLLVGSSTGRVLQTNESLAAPTTFVAGSGEAFVAYTVSSIPPVRVPFFTATSTNGQNFLEWLNPVGGSYSATMIRYTAVPFTSSCTPPVTPSQGTHLVTKVGTPGMRDFVGHGGIPNDNTTYCYTAFIDGAGGGPYSGGRVTRGRPFNSGAGKVRWAFRTGAASLTPPSLGTGVYAASNDRTLYAVVRGTAGGTWLSGFTPVALGEPAQNRSPVVPTIGVAGSDEVLFVGSQDGYVYAIDAKTGVRRWRTKLGDMVQAAPAGIFSDFSGSFDYVLAGTRNNAVNPDNLFYALKVADGTVVGTPFDGAGQGNVGIVSAGASVAYGLDRVFFSSRRRSGTGVNTVWGLDLSGAGVSYAWGRALGDIDGAPTRCGNSVFVGTNAGQVYALAPGDGATTWSFSTSDGAVKAFVFPDCSNGSLYLSTDTKVWGLTAGSPTSNWPAVTAIPSPSTPTFLPGTFLLFVGGSDGRLYQLDMTLANPTTPPAITSVVLGDGLSAVGRPTVDAANGILYVGTDAGIFYAVEIPIP